MTGSITTALPTSSKADYLSAAHEFIAGFTLTGTMAAGAQTITGLGTIANVAVGMPISSGTSLAAGCVVEQLLSTSSITVSRTAAAAINPGTFTLSGDAFYIALIQHNPTGTYGAGSLNYTDITGNADEVSGTGYTAGGLALTSTNPATSGTTAYTTPSGTVSWTSATINTDGCMIYNKTARLGTSSGSGATANGVNAGIGQGRAVYVGSFGGQQLVTAGTFTVVMPTNNASNALIRLQ